MTRLFTFKSHALAALAATAFLMASPMGAMAQTQQTGPNFADSLTDLSGENDGPIEISANSNQMDRNANTMTFLGNVVVNRGTVVLTTDRRVVHFLESVNDIQRIQAFGNVTVTSDNQQATSQRANFDVTTDIIIMEGNVLLTQGENRAAGERLTVNLTEGTTRLDAPQTAGSDGRVRAIFTPQERPGQERPAER